MTWIFVSTDYVHDCDRVVYRINKKEEVVKTKEVFSVKNSYS